MVVAPILEWYSCDTAFLYCNIHKFTCDRLEWAGVPNYKTIDTEDVHACMGMYHVCDHNPAGELCLPARMLPRHGRN